jgi:hypothetical protein
MEAWKSIMPRFNVDQLVETIFNPPSAFEGARKEPDVPGTPPKERVAPPGKLFDTELIRKDVVPREPDVLPKPDDGDEAEIYSPLRTVKKEAIDRERLDEVTGASWWKQGLRELKTGLVSAVQPLMRLTKAYTDKVIDPITGMIALGVTSILDNPSRPSEIASAYKQYRDEGLGVLGAAGEAFRSWEVNQWLKTAMEIVFDPLNLLGWGMLGKVPLVGGKLGTMEKAYITAVNAPFTYGARAGRAASQAFVEHVPFAPYTVERAVRGAKQRALDSGGRVIERLTKKSIEEVDDVEVVIDKMLATRRRVNPDLDTLHDVMLDALIDDPEMTLGLAVRFGAPISKEGRKVTEKLTRKESLGRLAERTTMLEKLQDVGGIHEDWVRVAKEYVSGGSLKEATDAGVRLFGLTVEEKNVEMVRNALEGLKDKFRNRLNSYRGLSGGEFVERLGAQLSNSVLRKETLAVGQRRAEAMGVVAGLLNKRVMPYLESHVYPTWMRIVNRGFMAPFAEAYLAFSAYGLGTVVEEAARSGLGGVYPRFMLPKEFVNMVKGIEGVPWEYFQAGRMSLAGEASVRRGSWSMPLLDIGSIPIEKQLKALGLRGDKAEFYLKFVGVSGGKLNVPGPFGRAGILASSEGSVSIRMNYIASKYRQILPSKIPMKNIAAYREVLENAPKELGRTPLGDDFIGGILDAVAYGPKAVKAMKERLTREVVKDADFERLMQEFTELVPEARAIGEDFARGKISHNDAIIKVREAVVKSMVDYPEELLGRINVVAENLKAVPIQPTAMDIQNRLSMMQYMEVAVKDAESRVLSAARRKAMQAGGNSKLREKVWKEADEALESLREGSDKALSELYDDIAQAAENIDMKSVREFIDAKNELRKHGADAAERVRLSKQKWIAEHGRPKGEEWADFEYNAIQVPWEEAQASLGGKLARMHLATMEMAGDIGAHITKAPKISLPKKWTPQALGEIMNIAPKDIETALSTVPTLMSQEGFVSYMMEVLSRRTDEVLGPKVENELRLLHKRLIGNSMPSTGMKAQLKLADKLVKEVSQLERVPTMTGRDLEKAYEWVDRVAAKARSIPREMRQAYQTAMHEAMKEAVELSKELFVDYSDPMFLDFIMKNIFPYWMYEQVPTTSTKILTKAGWKTCDEVEVGELVLTLDLERGVTHWEPLLHKNIQNVVDKDVVGFERKGVTVLSSENHRWPVVYKHNLQKGKVDFHFKTSPQLRERTHNVCTAAEHDGFPQDSALAPHDAAVLGWVIADGYVRKGSTLIIYQSEAKHLDEIKALLEEEGDSVNVWAHPGAPALKVPDACAERVLKYCVDKTLLPALVTGLSKEAAEAMWDAMWKAEGCDSDGRFVQKPGPVSEAFQMLSILLGKAITVSGGAMERVNILRGRFKEVRNLSRSTYTGRMWCPTTPSQTWLMNYEGRVMFTGNSRRLPFLVQQSIRHPGLLAAYGTYMNNTDLGYVSITDAVQFNPMRGLAPGVLRSLAMRDFPEFYSGKIFEMQDAVGRFGFFPGAPFDLGITALGTVQALGETGKLEFGGAIPPLYDTIMSSFIALTSKAGIEGGPLGIRNLRDLVAHSRYRDRNIDLLLRQRYGIRLDTLDKLVNDTTVPPERREELKQWKRDVLSSVSTWEAIQEQTGFFRLRPKELAQAKEYYAQAIEELFGLTVDEQKKLWAAGIRPTDVIRMSPEEARLLSSIEGAIYRGSTRRIQPLKWQVVWDKQEDFYEEVDARLKRRFAEQLADDRLFLEGKLPPRGRADKRSTRMQGFVQSRNDLQASYEADGVPIRWQSDDPNVPSIEKWRIENDFVVPPMHPLRTMLDDYYSVELTTLPNGMPDWDTFFAERDEILDAAKAGPYGKEFMAELQKNMTPLEKLEDNVKRTVLDDYWKVRNEVLDGLPSMMQEQVWKALKGPFLEQIEARKSLAYRLYMTRLAERRQRMRRLDPDLEYWLYYFGYISTFENPAAERKWKRYGLTPPEVPDPETWPESLSDLRRKELETSRLEHKLTVPLGEAEVVR